MKSNSENQAGRAFVQQPNWVALRTPTTANCVAILLAVVGALQLLRSLRTAYVER